MFKFITKNTVREWGQFSSKIDGMTTKFSIIDLPKELIDDFIDYQINNYVKNEFVQQVAGIPYSSKALDECRDVLKKQCENPLYRHVICCPEVEGNIIPKIVASAITKSITKSDRFDDYPPARTKEVANFYEIDRNWYKLFSIPDLMEKHGVNVSIEFMIISVHSDYRRQGIANKIFAIRPIWHRLHDNGLSYAFFSSEASEKAAARAGWITESKIRPDEFLNKSNVTLKSIHPPPFFTLMSLRF